MNVVCTVRDDEFMCHDATGGVSRCGRIFGGSCEQVHSSKATVLAYRATGVVGVYMVLTTLDSSRSGPPFRSGGRLPHFQLLLGLTPSLAPLLHRLQYSKHRRPQRTLAKIVPLRDPQNST